MSIHRNLAQLSLFLFVIGTLQAATVAELGAPPATDSRRAALEVFASHESEALAAALSDTPAPVDIALPAGETWVGTVKVPAMPEGGILTFNVNRSGYSASAERSQDSTDGRDGSWSDLPLTLWVPEVSGEMRLQKLDIPALGKPQWIRLSIPNPSADHNSQIREVELHAFDPEKQDDYWLAVGASITRTSTNHSLFRKRVRELFGEERDPVLFNLATGGATTGTWLPDGPGQLERAFELHPRARYVLIHIGGNNVSAGRPFKEGDPEDLRIRNDLEKIYQAVIAAGKIPLPARLSYRDYKKPPLVNGGENPENGSLPYNEQLIDPLIREMAPYAYDEAAGRGRIDPYTFFLKNPHYLGGDGIHLADKGRQAWTTEVFARQGGEIVYQIKPAGAVQTQVSPDRP